MPDSPEKLDLRSLDIAADKRRQLRQLFPEVFTESSDAAGNPAELDFEKLKAVLGEHLTLADPRAERYGLEWPGKRDALKAVQTPALGTLIPCPEESVDWDTTKNVFIEGDNLEVLKLLQKAYYGKVKMIYIDPPYNTGNDFVYPDNYAESLDTYLRYTGQVSGEGVKLTTNSKDSGRFHSNWLRMMYPRLYVAKNLLREDGVIFISIDDNEVSRLRDVCDQIFGEENYLASVVWEKSRKNDAKFFSVGHEYLLVYAKSQASLRELKTLWREEKPGAREIWQKFLELREKHGMVRERIEPELADWFSQLPKSHPAKKWSRYKRVDEHGPWRDRDISWPGGDGPRYDVIHPVTKQPCVVPEAGWRYSKSEEMQRMIRLGLVEFRDDHNEPPFRKAHIKPIPEEIEVEDSDESDDEEEEGEGFATQVRGSCFYKQSQVSVKYLRKLMGAKVFNNPKDHEELAKLIDYATTGESSPLICDFFAGSGSTAEAVFSLGIVSERRFRWLGIQLPEKTFEIDSEGKEKPLKKEAKTAYQNGFPTIADLAKERIRRAGAKIRAELEAKAAEHDGELALESSTTGSPSSPPDLGFRVFKLAPSNFKRWDGEAAAGSVEALEQQLVANLDHLADHATEPGMLFEILLKAGYELTCPVETLELAGRPVYSVDGGGLLLCLAERIDSALIDAVAARQPQVFICLDRALHGDDALKVNALETFRACQPEIQFRTV